jgi:ABC-2 type transport system ATP-binding protein
MSIQACNLTKTYAKKTVVKDLSFDVLSGVVTGFLGPNGAGKSTTMRLILGFDLADSGTATINGKRISEFASPNRCCCDLPSPPDWSATSCETNDQPAN